MFGAIARFPDVRNGIPDTVLVAEIDSFAGRVGLRYGTYHGVGIYLIDAPGCMTGRVARTTINPCMPTPITIAALRCWAGWPASWPRAGSLLATAAGARSRLARRPDLRLSGRQRPPGALGIHGAQPGLSGAVLCPSRDRAVAAGVVYDVYGLEFYGQMSFLKAGLFYADHVTAVSPTYAREITRPEFGYGMEGLLQERQRQGRLSGILNGWTTRFGIRPTTRG